MTNELDESLDRVSHRIDALLAERSQLLDTLHDILVMAEEREDVVDGEDGSPRPDAWMQVAQMAREALEAAGVTP